MNADGIEGLEVQTYDGDFFRPLVVFDAWRIAALNHGPHFECLRRLERHLQTDESFVLLAGEATLHIGEDAKAVPMSIGAVYNVRKGTWHTIVTRPGARCLVVENADTSRDNTEYLDL